MPSLSAQYIPPISSFFYLVYAISVFMYRKGTSPGSPPDYFKGQSHRHSIAYITRCIQAIIKPRPTWT